MGKIRERVQKQLVAWLLAFIFLFLSIELNCSSAWGDEIRVAVAANFLTAFNSIAREFESETGHTVLVSPGSTGKLYVQIRNEAPFDLFLSADSRRPEILEEEGFAVQGSRFTYAVGRVTLWSSDPLLLRNDGRAVLSQESFDYLAIANPKTAPYGRAALQILKALKLWETLKDRLVFGENIGQTFQFVFTGNAQLGFVALSQVLDSKFNNMGSRWDVPPALYDPLTQQAVLLVGGENNHAAKAFLDFMKGEKARTIIERFGYGTE